MASQDAKAVGGASLAGFGKAVCQIRIHYLYVLWLSLYVVMIG